MITLTVHGLNQEQADNIQKACRSIGSQSLRQSMSFACVTALDGYVDLHALNWQTAGAVASVLMDEDSGADYLA